MDFFFSKCVLKFWWHGRQSGIIIIYIIETKIQKKQNPWNWGMKWIEEVCFRTCAPEVSSSISHNQEHTKECVDLSLVSVSQTEISASCSVLLFTCNSELVSRLHFLISYLTFWASQYLESRYWTDTETESKQSIIINQRERGRERQIDRCFYCYPIGLTL